MYSYLSNRLQTTSGLQLVDSVSLRLAIRATLGHRTLAASTSDADAIDHVSLLGAEPKTTGLVRTGRPGSAHQLRQLTVLPDANAQQVSEDIALLLAVQLLHITVSSHLGPVNVWIDLATKSN